MSQQHMSILRAFGYATVLCLLLTACTSQNESTESDFSQLEVSSNGVLGVDSSGTLTQIAESPSASALGIAERKVESIHNIAGDLVAAQNVIHVNSRYVFIKGLGKSSSSSHKNKILDLNDGSLVPLDKWPDNSAKVTSNDTYAFFVSSGSIYAVELSSGKSTLISSQVNMWQYDLSGYNNSQTSAWARDSWIFVDSNSNVYGVYYMSLNNGYNMGYGAKYSFASGRWSEDVTFNQTFFPNMPYGASSQLPGCLLMNSSWTVVDRSNGEVYLVEMTGSVLKVKSYDVSTWSSGSVLLSFNLSHSITDSTFLGVDNSIQNGIITDGQSIIKLSSDSGALSAEEISVPGSITVDNYINSPSGYVEQWPSAGVTNWNYIQGSLFYYNDSDQSAYLWDLNPVHSPISLGNLPWMKFKNLNN